jgi:uncharacterized membrane protein YfcA
MISVTGWEFELLLVGVSVFAGALGSLLGLGGGAIIVPLLTLGFGVNIRVAIGAAIVSVIATSSGAAIAYVKDHLSNVRIGMFLEIGTVTGAISGALLTTVLPDKILFVLFGMLLGYSAYTMIRQKQLKEGEVKKLKPDKIAEKLNLSGVYEDRLTKTKTNYRAQRSLSGLGLMYLAGCLSALLGIGSGALKVPAMDLVMGLPIKVSTSTSNFMIGVTAAASAGIYFLRGYVNPLLSGPVAIGILSGALIGTRLLAKISNNRLRVLFVIVLAFIAVEMLLKGLA